jgi:signal transduction histidine kinase
MNDRTRQSPAFFVLYACVLSFAVVWSYFPYVLERSGDNIVLFRGLLAFAACYLGVRTYRVLLRGVPEGRRHVWLALDLVIITLAIKLTGGIRSNAALIYFWPLVTSSIERRPKMTLALGLVTTVLYVAAVWPPQPNVADPLAKAVTYVFIILLATALAVLYARREVARVREMLRLREQLALADYRSRLSQEMHDGIQHYLVRIATRLDLARALADREPGQAVRIATDQRLTVRQAGDELRYLVRRLRSPVLERLGFVDALRDHLAMFAERSCVKAPLRIEGTATSLPPDVEQAAFRIVQEALTNAEKYAQASEVQVLLRFGDDVFDCVLADDGVGFHADPQATDEPGPDSGFGLVSMRERAESVGGRLAVDSAPGHGTRVTFTVPAPNDSAAQSKGGHNGQDQAADC